MNASFQAQITKVSGKATTDKGGAIRRHCTLELLREFDDEIAEAIGDGAQKILEPISNLAIKRADVPIDALNVEIALECTEADGLKRGCAVVARGVLAKIKGGAEDREPTVKLTFSFPFSDDVWVFLGRNYAATAKVDIRPAQLEIPGTEAKKNGRKAKASEAPAAH